MMSLQMQRKRSIIWRSPPINLVKHFQLVDKATIFLSNSHYAKYGAVYMVENLACTEEELLNSCEEHPRDKLHKWLVSMSATEKG